MAAIAPEMSAAERERARRKSPDSLNTWEAYQRGLWHVYKFTGDDSLQARAWFRKACDADPEFAPARAALGYAHFLAAVMDYPKFDLDEAIAASRAAVNIDNKDAMAHFSLGRLIMLVRRHDEAIEELSLAAELDPQSDVIRYGLAHALLVGGRLEDSLIELDKAVVINPNSPLLWAIDALRGHTLLVLGKDIEAYSLLQRASRRPAADFWPHLMLVAARMKLGQEEEARLAMQELLSRDMRPSKEIVERCFPFRDPVQGRVLLDALQAAGLPPTIGKAAT